MNAKANAWVKCVDELRMCLSRRWIAQVDCVGEFCRQLAVNWTQPRSAGPLHRTPIQGGLDPKVLLTDKENLHTEVTKYLQIFKDHPYVFNLGHGILPETKIDMVEELVKTVRDFK